MQVQRANVLENGNIKIQVVSDEGIQRLQFNHGGIIFFGRKRFFSIKTYVVIVQGVLITKIDIENPDTTQWLAIQNVDAFHNMNIR